MPVTLIVKTMQLYHSMLRMLIHDVQTEKCQHNWKKFTTDSKKSMHLLPSHVPALSSLVRFPMLLCIFCLISALTIFFFAGLGFTPEMQGQATKEFSGGWRMRISLARALFCQPDILLLDGMCSKSCTFSTINSCGCLALLTSSFIQNRQIIWIFMPLCVCVRSLFPSLRLSFSFLVRFFSSGRCCAYLSRIFISGLESYLQQWKGSVLIVPHLREFLNAVATDIIHLHNKKLEHYKGK
jgi:hypothetical protein